MTNLMKRSLALLTALFLCLSLLPTTLVTVNAASYIYNWGTRGTTATSLSENAQAFYANTTYDSLATLAGGTSTDTVPDSALYSALQNLMKDAHSTETSYDGTRELYQYTDCQNGGGAISSFYSGVEIGPDWDSGATWNREHTWPNSKGLGGNDENDIMMLRPTSVSENSSRGNTAYGESSGYYNPYTEFNGAYDVRGDVARIFLYVYVRWGNVDGNDEGYDTWGSNGVMESPEVMLSWMQADPVDTWEMGRNDSVQSITGTRNVFVDYPELAFRLFGEEVPADMTTPSNKAAECQHTYVDGVCSSCGAEQPVVTATVDKTITFDTNKTQRTSFSSTQQVWQNDGVVFTNDKASSSNAVADYSPVRIYAGSSVTIAHPGMTQIVFVCNASKYVTPLTNSLGDAAYTVDGNNVTVTLATPQDTFTIASISAQTRFNSITVTVPADAVTCQHTNTTIEGAKEATCTEIGHTGKTICSACGEIVDAGEEIPVIDHTYVDGACSVCGAKDFSGFETTTATITFDVAEGKRTEYSTEKQVWIENGITVTNNKSKATTDVADAVAPVKFYAHSELIIAYPSMSVIVFNCNTASYANALQTSIGDTAVVDEKVVTLTLAEATDTFTIADLSAQVRVDSITVTAISCSHADTTVEGKADATCTENGHTGNTVCTVCGATVTEGEVIEATGHTYVDGTCSACGEADPSVTPDEPETTAGGKADFNTINSTNGSSSYGGSYTTTDGWTIVNSAIHVGTSSADSNPKFQVVGPDNTYKAVCINGKTTAPGKITSPTLAGGITKLTMRYTFMFGDTKLGATITVTDLATGEIYTDTISLTVTSAEKLQVKDYEWVLETPITGAFTIEVVNSCPSNSTSNKDRMTILDLAWETSANAPACEHTNTTVANQKDATCLEDGYTGDTICTVCGITLAEGEAIGKLGHNFVEGACQRCGVKEPEAALATSQAYKFGMIQENVSATDVYYITGAMSGHYMATTTVADDAVDVYVEETEGGYYLYTYINSVKHYINMVVSDTYVNGAFETTASTVYTFNAEKGTLIAIVNDAEYWFGTRNDGTYTTVGPVKVEYNGFYCKLYKFVEGNPNEPTCQHTNTTVVGAKEATCTEDGHTGATVCDACGVTIDAGEVIAAGHKYVDGACSVCGEKEPLMATITFDDTAKRTAFDTTQQIWVENGITVTNLKGTSTSDVADHSAPARFYKNSSLKVEYSGMTKIEFTCYSASYATALASSISDATVATNNKVVTVTFDAPQDAFEIAALSGGQVRMDSITVTYAEVEEEPVCEEHSFVDGVCSGCGHKLGDINGDDTVTYQDAVYMLLANMFPDQYTLDGVYADVNGDGVIADVNDAVYLLLHVLFGDLFYPLRTAVVG